MSAYQQQIKQFDEILLSKIPNIEQSPNQLHQAMHYVLLNGGKRLRPLLVYFTGQIFSTPIENLHNAACAVECIHAYSLVHDDLPAMDDDDYRRGKPSCHKAFDEAIAILVGDALQALAFQLLTSSEHQQIPPEKKLQMVQCLSIAAGSQGMVGGQSLDLLSEGKKINLDALQNIHQWKTGALIQASVELGMLASKSVSEVEAEHLREFAKCLGLAFQIRDDIKDIEGDLTTLGKQPGGDMEKQKATYPSLIGLVQAKETLAGLTQRAHDCLDVFSNKAENLELLLSKMV